MNGYCLEKDILYLAHITSELPNYVTKEYKGICATTWKERFGNHKKVFRNEDYETDTALKGSMAIKTERMHVQHNVAKRPEFSVVRS